MHETEQCTRAHCFFHIRIVSIVVPLHKGWDYAWHTTFVPRILSLAQVNLAWRGPSIRPDLSLQSTQHKT